MEEGDIVEVLASDGRFLAIGHWQIGSIAVRVLTFKRQPINQAFWQKRLAAALDVRKTIGVVGRADNDIFRLVHGEGDNLPGLVIDIYGGTAVMQAHSVGMHVCRHELAEALKAVMGESLKAIYYKSETTLPFKAQLGQENGFLFGESNDDVARENGLKFHIDWLKGQKTGFFVDQRDNRALVEHYAKGRKVLNMFCYTGGFSVYAMRGGAELVHSVDSSAKAVELVDANMELNFPGDTRHKAFAEDAFKFMEQDLPLPSLKGRESSPFKGELERVFQIGYPYTVEFTIEWADEKPGTVLCTSERSTFYLSDPIKGMLGFSRDGYLFQFKYKGKPGKRETIQLKGDNKGISLYADGRLVENLKPDTGHRTDNKKSTYKIMRTLVFPLQETGDFRSRITDFKAWR